MKFNLFILFILLLISCGKESFELSSQADDFFFLSNEGADMPVWVQGNTQSKNLIVMLHGGPGGSAFIIDSFFEDFTSPLEKEYGIVYWEQRNSGTSQGNLSTKNLTPDIFVADLEKLIILLKNKYGADTQLFLMGISWGGYLGNAYLVKGDNQKNIQGWINIVGPHDFLAMANIGNEKLIHFANQQIPLSKNTEEWNEIKEWSIQHPVIINLEDFLQENKYANSSDILMKDSLQVEIPAAPIGDQLSFAFFSPFNSNAWISNFNGILESNMIETILQNPLTDKISNINIPAMIIGGNFDVVVPEETLQDQFNLLGSPDKEIHILQKSAHGLIGHEVTKLNLLISDFMAKHR